MSVGAPELLSEGSVLDVAAETDGTEIAARSPLQLFWRRFRQDNVALVSLGVIVLLVLAAIFAPVITKLVGAPGPNTQNTNALSSFGTPTGPSHNALWPFIVAAGGVLIAIILASTPWDRVRRRGPLI